MTKTQKKIEEKDEEERQNENGGEISRPFRERERHVCPQNGRGAMFARRALCCLHRADQRGFPPVLSGPRADLIAGV